MNYKLKTSVIILSVLLTSGCSGTPNRTLSPPSDTQWVNVEVKNPSQYTKPFPLEVRYISHKCLKKRISGVDGSVITEPNYNVINVPLQQGANDLWKAKVAMTGGGACEWTLSAFNVGIEYIDATHLGKDLVPGTAVGATISFDDDASRNGQFTFSPGDLSLEPKYYPLIKTNKMVHAIDTLNLFGEEDFLQKRISSISKSLSVNYSPKIDESKIVRMVSPKEYKIGAFYKIIYPDGTVVSDGSTHPDIKKLEK
ncbi:hypothetical protein [Rahnella sikkimica]|uniref:Lipoprotein n=1 Tax=Rahnella sikkimica TaxID=1805933 RepID=A0A2L1UXC1_9GAMM|nr:hypothetical protein [Rahnella sikkimica]AVF37534.1 hypothetical protein BV494_21600 [Rahnella sikkimica]